MSTTPTTPQWAIEAAKEMFPFGRTSYVGADPEALRAHLDREWKLAASVMARHATPSTPAAPVAETPTPKTDAVVEFDDFTNNGEPIGVVPVDFARQLERDLAALRAVAEELAGAMAMAKCPECDGSGVVQRMNGNTEYVSREMALDAGDPSLEGSVYREAEPEVCQCGFCAMKAELLTRFRAAANPAQRGEGKL